MTMRVRVLLRAVVLLAMAAASRTALCETVHYTAGGGTEFWSDPANWSGNAVPGVSDDVVIPNAGTGTVRIDVNPTVNSITVQNGAILRVGSGQVLTVNDASTIDPGGALFVHSSTFSGSGTLTVRGDIEVHAGTVGGSGMLTIDSGGRLWVFAQPFSPSVISRTTTNAGKIVYKDTGAPGFNYPFIFSGATLTNTGIIDIQTDNDINPGPGPRSPILYNNSGGVIKRSACNRIASINFTVNNAAGATIATHSGHFYLNGGGTVSGTYSILSGSQLRLGGGTFTMRDNPKVIGDGELHIVGATPIGAMLVADVDVTLPNVFLFSGGNIAGAGTVSVRDRFVWYGGKIKGKGLRVLNSASAASFTCIPNCRLDGAALQLQASAQFVHSSAIEFSNGARLTIDPDKTLSISKDGNLTNGDDAANLIINNGTIHKSGGSGTSTIFPIVHNAGTVRATTGTLALAGGGTHTGLFNVMSPGSLSFSSGTHSMSGGDPTGGGGSIVGNGTLTFSGATAKVGVRVKVGALSLSAGTVELDADGSADAFTMTGGTLGGTGVLMLNNGGTWSGGTMSGSGKTINPATKSLGISAPVTLDSRTLQNYGMLSVGGDVLGSGTIDNDNSGTLNAVADVTIGAVLNNSGQVATSNALSLAGGGTHTGSFSVTAPGNLSFSSGKHSLSGGSIRGTGTLTFSGDTATVGVPVNVGALSVTGGTATLDADGSADAFTMTGGTLGGTGVLMLNNGGTWSGGTMSGSGKTINPATKSLGISAPVTLDSRTLQNDGTLSVGGDILGSGTIDNGDTLNAVADVTIGAVLNNRGQVVTSNALSLAGGGGKHTGSFGITAPGNLSFSSGAHSISGGGSISGSGTLTFSADTATVGVPINVGALSVTGGAATLDADGSAEAFTMTGGTLGGNGTLTLNNGGTWSGGTMSGSGKTINPATKSLGISAPVTLDGRVLQNDGMLNVSGNITGSGTIDNGGTLNAVADVTIDAVVNNSGQVATSGAMSLAGGGTHTGSFNVTTPGILSFASGTHSVSGGGSISGSGALIFSGATATIGVPVNVGALSVSNGTATLDANGSADAFTMTGGMLGGSGTLTLNGGGTWSGGTMSGSGKTINPVTKSLGISAPVALSRVLQNDGTLNVSGDIAGSGTIDNGGTLNAVADLTIGAVVNNGGQIATSNALSLAGGGTHTGSFTVTTPGNLSFSSGTHSMSGGGSIGGTGTLMFSGATATVGVPVDVGALSFSAGTATLNANGSADAFSMTGGSLGGSGTLTLSNGGTWSDGTMSGSGKTINPAAKTLSISAPVTLDSRTLQNDGALSVSGNVAGSGTIANNSTLNAVADLTIGAALNNSGEVVTNNVLSLGGNGAHDGTFTATAPGMIDFSGGTHTISGALAGTGALRFSGAAATVGGTWSGMPIEVTGGSAALDTDGTIPALTLSGGTLAGSGDVTVSGPSTWSGGTLAGSGAFTFDTGSTVTMPGTHAVTLARPLRNKGTIHYTAASNGMLIAGVEVRNDGTFDIQSSQGITATAGTPPFVNRGTLKKSGGSGVLQFDAPLSNRGLVRIESGTMHFGRTCKQHAGRTTILSGATLQTATFSLDGGSLTGNGTVAGTVANDATVSPGASPGTLTIEGDYVQSQNGALDIQMGGTAAGTQFDQLLVGGSVTLGGTLNVTALNGFVPTAGNEFRILTFSSRPGNSTFAVMNGLTGFGTAFRATDLRLIASPTPVADVSVRVTGPVSTIAGTKVIYTVTVSNHGPDPATNIAVTATSESPELTFSGNGVACVESFPCTISTLGSGQSATILTAWDIAPSATDAVTLTVDVSSATDANPLNNSASAITNIGPCPAILINAPIEMTTGAAAEATATPFGKAAYQWSIDNGTIDSGNGTNRITFTAGEAGTARLTVNVIGDGCTLDAIFDVTVKPRLTCVGTAAPTAPADGATIDAVTDFRWDAVEGASGYRLWLQKGDEPAQSLGTTLDSSLTRIIPPGEHQWYVETLFDGCASHESERRTLTIPEAQDCASREKPQLSAPANDTPATSAAVDFSWSAVAQALQYELWLAPKGGVPTLIATPRGTSHTAVVPPGRLEWYVRAVFAGCAATESIHREFTCTPPPGCTSERPLLIAPLERERLTSPASFEWTRVSGATSYELYVDGILAATTTSPQASAIPMARGERRWRVRARLAEGCGAVDSAESRLVDIVPPSSCAPLGTPVISAPAQISSGVAGRIQWTFVPGATAYDVEISSDPRFPRQSTSSTTVTTRQLPFTFTNQSSEPAPHYVRVHAIDRNCVQEGTGPFSPVAVLTVLPATSNEGAAPLTDPTYVPFTLGIAAEHAGRSFTATPTVPWISVTPASGIVPPGGQTLRALADTTGLPPGTSIGRVRIVITGGGVSTTLPTPPILLNLIPGVRTAPKSTPPPDALIIPAVANVTNFIVRYHTDISVTNTSAQVMRYEINFVPSGPAGISDGQKTEVSLEPGVTMAIRDIVATWFGGRSSTGTLEIRPLTETEPSTSSAPVGGLTDRITFASSRTWSTTPAGGTYGQYVPAVPYANFVTRGSALSLQHVAQSDQYRTNLGLVEGSGEKVSVEVRIFDAAGTKRASFPVDLNGGERKQLDRVLQQHDVALDDGRIEVEVTSGAGKVTAYASVVDNATNDSQLVPPVTLDPAAGRNKWVVPGVADLDSGFGNSNWQTDVRIYNAGTEPAELTLELYSMNGGPATTRTITLAAGQVRPFDRVLSFFAISGDAGALHVSSTAPAQVIATARTYKQTGNGAYGQFIAAGTPDEAVAVGSRPLQILQMEESERFKSNIGFAEVSGKPVTLEVAVFRHNSTDPTLLPVELEPNQFRQLSSLLASLGLGEMYNARISVRAVGGEGRALAYGSLIDHKTGDPTYIPGQ